MKPIINPTGRFFPQYSLEDRQTIWDGLYPKFRDQFSDEDFEVAQNELSGSQPDYETWTDYEGIPFDPSDKVHVAMAHALGNRDFHWYDEFEDENDFEDDKEKEITMPSIESMIKKAKGLDLAEEAPSEEESTPSEEQRSRVYDKLTDENGDSRLKHKANVPALENYDQDIHAPQGEVHDADKLKTTRKSAGIREMVARKCFEKTGRIPDVEFMDSYEVKKAADETDIEDLQGAASKKGLRYDKFQFPEFKDGRKAVSEMVNHTSPKFLNPSYEERGGPDGMYETSDIGGNYASKIRQMGRGDGEIFLSEMEGPLEKAIHGVLTKRGMSPEDIQSTIRQIKSGYEDFRDGYYYV